MFNIELNNNVDFGFLDIQDEYTVLHFDEEPILFSGKNKYGNNILASLIEEDDDDEKLYYFYTLIRDDIFRKYLAKKICYRTALEFSNSTFLVIKNFQNIAISSTPLLIENIPEEYLPLKNAFCPYVTKEHSFDYALSLKGGLADKFRAIPQELSIVQSKFSHIIEKAFEELKVIGLSPHVFQEAYSKGSFELNFNVEFTKDIFPDEAKISNYLNEYLEYCMNYLSEEAEMIFGEHGTEIPNKFNNLLHHYSELHEGFEGDKNDFTIQLKERLLKSAIKFRDIGDQIGSNFKSVEINNLENNITRPIGQIDEEYTSSIEDVILFANNFDDSVEIDEDFKDYEIYIYHFNIDTRTGNAFIQNSDEVKGQSRPRIKINGDAPLEETMYTKSLSRHDWINVKAKATWKNKKVRQLEIQFQQD